MCNNYEDQLQSVQDEMKAEKMKVRSLERELVAEKQTIDAQKKYIEELEKSVKDSAVEAETEVQVNRIIALSSGSIVIRLSLGSIEADHVISELCYNEVTFYRHITK